MRTLFIILLSLCLMTTQTTITSHAQNFPSGAAGTPRRNVWVPAPAVSPVKGSTRSEPDGALVYERNCATCHGWAKRGKPASAIFNAINGNTGGMGYLKRLSEAQVRAISGLKD